MILVKEQLLHYRDSISDKVYEVALFQLSENEFVVNFKFGRRGSRLQEGTKTVYPVAREAAESIFDKLVTQKVAKGYRRIHDRRELDQSVKQESNDGDDIRKDKVLHYLESFANGTPQAINWKLSRIIWRAGELRLAGAEAAILRLLPRLSGQEKYAAIWYLGRMQSDASQQALATIDGVSGKTYEHIYDGAIASYGEAADIASISARLPAQLNQLFTARQYEAYVERMREVLFDFKSTNNQYLLDTYLLCLSNDEFKKRFLPLLDALLPIPNYWKYLRYIFKIAEMLDDAPTLGLLSMTVVRSMPGVSSLYVFTRGQYHHRREELRRPDAKIAFSKQTKNYFIRRVIRNLERNGKLGYTYYCELAAAILTSIREEDHLFERHEYVYVQNPQTNRYQREERYYSSTAHIPFIYEILYAGGTSYHMTGIKPFNQRSRSTPTAREEKYPALWNENPHQIVKLIAHGNIEEIVLAGIRMSADIADFHQYISLEDIKPMVAKSFPSLVDFTSQHIRATYSGSHHSSELINILLATDIASYHDIALSMVQSNASVFAENEEGLVLAMLLDHQPWHEWLRQNIRDSQIVADTASNIVNRTLEHLGKVNIQEVSELTIDTLFHCFHKTVSTTSTDDILQLLAAPEEIKQLLGAKLMTAKNIPSDQWPSNLIATLLQSEHAIVRGRGMELLSSLSDAEIMAKDDLLTALMTSDLQDLRQHVRSIIQRLSANSSFRDRMFLRLYPVLLKNHEDEDLPTDVYEVINTYLHPSLALLLPNIEEVLQDNHRETHLLTWRFLNEQADLTNWPISMIAVMGHHDMKQIRQLAMDFYDNHESIIKENLHDALSILASDWPEVQAWATAYFDEKIEDALWSPSLIVSLCDHIHPHAQGYGIRLLGRLFNSDHGVKYLTQLSEHPNERIQLYTTNYLDGYAFNNVDVLTRLLPYFKTVLMSINKNRVGKARVFRFIKKQIIEGPEYAALFAPLLNNLVQTIAIMNRSEIILLLHTIKNKFPHIDVALTDAPADIRVKS